ncbi:hypothetical protein JTB14_036043 [Gonioctena quinquepunctata]|nr:hypothetical protein JTB14_036043 [Gonioctena quinquepunctata]
MQSILTMKSRSSVLLRYAVDLHGVFLNKKLFWRPPFEFSPIIFEVVKKIMVGNYKKEGLRALWSTENLSEAINNIQSNTISIRQAS